MNKEIKTISKTFVVVCLCILSYKMGKGDKLPQLVKTVEIENMTHGFCMSCYKEHTWKDMYVISSEFELK